MLSADQVQSYQDNGYVCVRGLYSPEETAVLRDHYMDLRARGEYPGDYKGNGGPNDAWAKFPRMIHMHRWDERSLQWMIDVRMNAVMTALLGGEPLAVQTMLYFKPPGARGQAMHQDQFYLRAAPGTCMATWLALDRCDQENGCLRVAPGSHRLPLLCNKDANLEESFTNTAVEVPPNVPVQDMLMDEGDVLFFHGALIHGSLPNRSSERFRRALIGHYISGAAREVSQFYHPVHRMDGSIVELTASGGGGPCGNWVNRAGELVVEMSGVFAAR